MYIAGTEITITWVLPPTDTPFQYATSYDIRFVPSNLDGTYLDGVIDDPVLVNYVRPTAGYPGSMQWLFTPLYIGLYQVYLTVGDDDDYDILDKKTFWAFADAPVSVASTEALGISKIAGSIYKNQDIVDASYSGISFSVSAWANLPQIDVTKDDEKLYLMEKTGSGELFEFDLITPSNISTADYTTNNLAVPKAGFNFRVSDDGLNFWLVGTPGDWETWAMSTAHDISSGTDVTTTTVGAPNMTDIGDFFWEPGGLMMHCAGSRNGFDGGQTAIETYACNTPYDMSTWSSPTGIQVKSLDIDAYIPLGADCVGIEYTDGGTKLFVLSKTSGNPGVHQWDLGIGHDLDTAIYNSFLSTLAEDADPRSLRMGADEKTFWILGNTNDKIFQYNI
jgi:hypothetical protein